MMNSSLTLSHVAVGTDEFAGLSSGETTPFDASTETPRKFQRFNWTSFDELFEKASPTLSALYLIGAIGFSAVLVFNAFVN
jgi:hypothetical protein